MISLGYEMAVKNLIKEAENDACDYFSVKSGEKEVNLINLECLRQITAKDEVSEQKNSSK